MYKFSAAFYGVLLSFLISGSAFAEEVRLSGECVGVKVYTDGLIITETMTLTDTDGKKVNIASGYGIKKGDIIKKINGREAVDAKTVAEEVKGGNITLTLSRNGKERDVYVTPVMTKDGAKLGLWLRDSTAGLGTITCVFGNSFVGLGHGICDVDTGNIMPVKYGIIQDCTDFGVLKGERGKPGAITGTIDGKKLGKVTSNSPSGICGTVLSPSEGKVIETADKSEVRVGAASILCDVDGNGVKEYAIEIKHISIAGGNGKDMVVKITDKSLIGKTGGIVQGMSGSPILQNGKLVGAVTHVFVNDPTRGYGIFIENMLEEANTIK